MAQYRVLASEGRQRYIYTKTHKNIKEKFTRMDYLSLVLTPLRIRWTIPERYCPVKIKVG
jgi:hypothetical protein